MSLFILYCIYVPKEQRRNKVYYFITLFRFFNTCHPIHLMTYLILSYTFIRYTCYTSTVENTIPSFYSFVLCINGCVFYRDLYICSLTIMTMKPFQSTHQPTITTLFQKRTRYENMKTLKRYKLRMKVFGYLF